MPNTIIRAAAEGMPNVNRSRTFDLVTDMEIPLATIDDLLEALGLIGETMGNYGNVVMRLAMLAQEQCKAVEAKRCELFRLSHPSRAHFDANGWPGEVAEGGEATALMTAGGVS